MRQNSQALLKFSLFPTSENNESKSSLVGHQLPALDESMIPLHNSTIVSLSKLWLLVEKLKNFTVIFGFKNVHEHDGEFEFVAESLVKKASSECRSLGSNKSSCIFTFTVFDAQLVLANHKRIHCVLLEPKALKAEPREG